MSDFFTGIFWGFMAGMLVTSFIASFVVWFELRKCDCHGEYNQ